MLAQWLNLYTSCPKLHIKLIILYTEKKMGNIFSSQGGNTQGTWKVYKNLS